MISRGGRKNYYGLKEYFPTLFLGKSSGNVIFSLAHDEGVGRANPDRTGLKASNMTAWGEAPCAQPQVRAVK
jgi:hypothetical protein